MNQWFVYDEYVFSGDDEIRRSNASNTKPLTLSDPSTQSQLFKDFVAIKNRNDILNWTEQYGFLKDRDIADKELDHLPHLVYFQLKTLLHRQSGLRNSEKR